MRVLMLTSVASPGNVLNEDEVYDLPPEEARALIARGQAEAQEPKANRRTAKETKRAS